MNKALLKQKMVNLGGYDYLVIDLTEALREDVEVYPGDPKPKKKIIKDFSNSSSRHNVYTLSDHNFHPHGDAPSHQNKDGRGFEVFGIDFCFNNACLIDLSDSAEAVEHDKINYLIEIKKQHLEPYSDLLSKKGALLIRTGYDRWLEANKPHSKEHIPYITKEAGDFLADFKNLKVIGTDSITIDAFGLHYVHKLFKDKLIVESLVNLYSIPEANRAGFDLQTSPVAIIGATGGPVKAYAFVGVGKHNEHNKTN